MSDAVHIQIRDTGKGIAEEHLPHIFEPFFSTKRTKRAPGSGCGSRASCRPRRSIKCAVARGAGTTFTIALPIGGLRRMASGSRVGCRS